MNEADNTETRRIWDESLGEIPRPCRPESGEVASPPPPECKFCFVVAGIFAFSAFLCVLVTAIAIFLKYRGQ